MPAVADLQRPAVGQARRPRWQSARRRRATYSGSSPALQHPGQPVDRSVRVAVAHGFVQRRDKIVVLLAVLVVQQATFSKGTAPAISMGPTALHAGQEFVRRSAPPSPTCSAPCARPRWQNLAIIASMSLGQLAPDSCRRSRAGPSAPGAAASAGSSGRTAPCSTNTLHRDRSAELISNEGFSVVAPIRMMLPCSDKWAGNASCCALLKR